MFLGFGKKIECLGCRVSHLDGHLEIKHEKKKEKTNTKMAERVTLVKTEKLYFVFLLSCIYSLKN